MAATSDVSAVYDEYVAESKEEIEACKATDIAEELEDIQTILGDIGSCEAKLDLKANQIPKNERLPQVTDHR